MKLGRQIRREVLVAIVASLVLVIMLGVILFLQCNSFNLKTGIPVAFAFVSVAALVAAFTKLARVNLEREIAIQKGEKKFHAILKSILLESWLGIWMAR